MCICQLLQIIEKVFCIRLKFQELCICDYQVCHFCVVFLILNNMLETRDGASTIQMYSSTITLNMHEYEYSENKCTRVRLLYNILEYEYDYFTI